MLEYTNGAALAIAQTIYRYFDRYSVCEFTFSIASRKSHPSRPESPSSHHRLFQLAKLTLFKLVEVSEEAVQFIPIRQYHAVHIDSLFRLWAMYRTQSAAESWFVDWKVNHFCQIKFIIFYFVVYRLQWLLYFNWPADLETCPWKKDLYFDITAFTKAG